MDGLSTPKQDKDENSAVEKLVKEKIVNLCKRFPVYSDMEEM